MPDVLLYFPCEGVQCQVNALEKCLTQEVSDVESISWYQETAQLVACNFWFGSGHLSEFPFVWT